MISHQTPSLVIMGVAGCGKSSLGAALAARLQRPLIEGDDHHSAASRDKMRTGIALTDADRAGWLAVLAGLLAQQPGGVVLTCSALRRAYRDQLRQSSAGLCFIFLSISPEAASRRVAERPAHFFNSALVSSQFATLEDPGGECGVLTLDATLPLDDLVTQAVQWLDDAALRPGKEA